MILPKWNDQKAVAVWVGKVIDKHRAAEELAISRVPWMKGAIFRLMERDAVEAAKGGNFRLLADMLHPKPKNPLLGQDRPPLKPETMELVCLRLVGEYKAPRRGPPKASPAQRSANTKSYDAANEMQLIELLLWRHYRGEKGIRRRAIEIAAERAGIDANTLWNYLKKNPRPSLFYK